MYGFSGTFGIKSKLLITAYRTLPDLALAHVTSFIFPTPVQPHGPPCYSLIRPSLLLPQGLCTRCSLSLKQVFPGLVPPDSSGVNLHSGPFLSSLATGEPAPHLPIESLPDSAKCCLWCLLTGILRFPHLNGSLLSTVPRHLEQYLAYSRCSINIF